MIHMSTENKLAAGSIAVLKQAGDDAVTRMIVIIIATFDSGD